MPGKSNTSPAYCPPSDHLAIPEPLDLRRAVAELRQNRLVMLPQSRRDADAGRRFGEIPRRAMHFQFPAFGYSTSVT